MPVTEMSQVPTTRWDRPADALTFLRQARETLRLAPAGSVDLEPMLQTIGDALDQVLGEHGGMAEELLSAYEQLGVVFEVTRRLPGVQSEAEVVALFLASLQRTFAGHRVVALRQRATGEWCVGSEPIAESLATVVRTACDSKAVTVSPDEDDGPAIAGLSACPATETPCHQVMVGPIMVGESVRHAIALLRPSGVPAFRRVDMLLLESLTRFCGDLLRNLQLMRELSDLSVAMVRSLVSAVDQKDPYTCGHSLRVAHFATQLARQLGLGVQDLRLLQWSALLHDVGKIGIRDAVLNKAGKLTPEEFEHMKEHPVRSHQVVSGVPQLRDALDGILYHHEHYDGGGYPEGLAGEDIPLQARIIQIADVFDALTSDRSYRKGNDWRKALTIMRDEAGRTIDPYLQSVFDRMIRTRLEDDEGAWAKLVAEASEFASGDGESLAEALTTSAAEGAIA